MKKMTFDGLGLSEPLLQTINDVGYDSPTPIQHDAIPPILARADVIGIAQTGTGKTAAFTLPLIDLLSHGRAKARMPRSLILSPTRELAQQTAENFKLYGKNHKLNHAVLIGGVSMVEQTRILDRGADVLIATPGRLLDHFERGRLLLNAIEILVIDEADRMLDMGFIPDIEKIVKLLPLKRQTLLFSATMPLPIEKLSTQFMRAPQRIAASMSGETAETVKQTLVWTSERDKIDLLEKHLRAIDGNAIVFCNRKRDVERVYNTLRRSKFDTEQLHGDMSQFRRGEVLEKFRGQAVPVLVASNVAARGLDIASIAHVINFDVPQNAEDYVHRIGRTGRAGKSGEAWTLATKEETDFVKAIEVLTGKDIPVLKGADRGKREDRGASANTGAGKHEDRHGDKHGDKHESRHESKRGGRQPKRKNSPPAEKLDHKHLPAFLSR